MRLFHLILLVSFSVPLTLGGCNSNSPTGPGNTMPRPARVPLSQDVVVSARWPFWPTRMRIHPLTTVTHDESGQAIIDARVEFFDQFGDSVKSVAQYRFELHDHDPGETEGQPLRMWSDKLDLRDIERNRLHFDPVTRTYRFRLDVESEDSARGRWLRCFALSLDGRRFIGRLQLR